jgi:hypothetical protein
LSDWTCSQRPVWPAPRLVNPFFPDSKFDNTRLLFIAVVRFPAKALALAVKFVKVTAPNGAPCLTSA